MKISVSLRDEDLEILDRVMERDGLPSRSAAIQTAIRQLAAPELEAAYAGAWAEWENSGDAELWARTAGDGISDATR